MREAGLGLREADLRLREAGLLDFVERFAGSFAARRAGKRVADECSQWSMQIHSFGAQFEPRYIFRAGRLDQ